MDLPAVAVDVDDHPLMRALGVLLAVIRLVQQVPTLRPTAIRVLHLSRLLPPFFGYRGSGPDKKISMICSNRRFSCSFQVESTV